VVDAGLAPSEGGPLLRDGAVECQSRCDCPQGWECLFGECQLLQSPVWCCDKELCPEGEPCIDARGIASQCGLPGPPVGGVS
jgi:hypothetical protein